MTRLALIFSLLFVTPAWAESGAMQCGSNVYIDTYKYEANFLKDKCYHRDDGRWNLMDDYDATDWSCVRENAGAKMIIDFVAMTSKVWLAGSGWNNRPCKDIELPD